MWPDQGSPGALGAADQQERIGGRDEDERHRRPQERGIGVIGGRVARREPIPQPFEAIDSVAVRVAASAAAPAAGGRAEAAEVGGLAAGRRAAR